MLNETAAADRIEEKTVSVVDAVTVAFGSIRTDADSKLHESRACTPAAKDLFERADRLAKKSSVLPPNAGQANAPDLSSNYLSRSTWDSGLGWLTGQALRSVALDPAYSSLHELLEPASKGNHPPAEERSMCKFNHVDQHLPNWADALDTRRWSNMYGNPETTKVRKDGTFREDDDPFRSGPCRQREFLPYANFNKLPPQVPDTYIPVPDYVTKRRNEWKLWDDEDNLIKPKQPRVIQVGTSVISKAAEEGLDKVDMDGLGPYAGFKDSQGRSPNPFDWPDDATAVIYNDIELTNWYNGESRTKSTMMDNDDSESCGQPELYFAPSLGYRAPKNWGYRDFGESYLHALWGAFEMNHLNEIPAHKLPRTADEINKRADYLDEFTTHIVNPSKAGEGGMKLMIKNENTFFPRPSIYWRVNDKEVEDQPLYPNFATMPRYPMPIVRGSCVLMTSGFWNSMAWDNKEIAVCPLSHKSNSVTNWLQSPDGLSIRATKSLKQIDDVTKLPRTDLENFAPVRPTTFFSDAQYSYQYPTKEMEAHQEFLMGKALDVGLANECLPPGTSPQFVHLRKGYTWDDQTMLLQMVNLAKTLEEARPCVLSETTFDGNSSAQTNIDALIVPLFVHSVLHRLGKWSNYFPPANTQANRTWLWAEQPLDLSNPSSGPIITDDWEFPDSTSFLKREDFFPAEDSSNADKFDDARRRRYGDIEGGPLDEEHIEATLTKIPFDALNEVLYDALCSFLHQASKSGCRAWWPNDGSGEGRDKFDWNTFIPYVKFLLDGRPALTSSKSFETTKDNMDKNFPRSVYDVLAPGNMTSPDPTFIPNPESGLGTTIPLGMVKPQFMCNGKAVKMRDLGDYSDWIDEPLGAAKSDPIRFTFGNHDPSETHVVNAAEYEIRGQDGITDPLPGRSVHSLEMSRIQSTAEQKATRDRMCDLGRLVLESGSLSKLIDFMSYVKAHDNGLTFKHLGGMTSGFGAFILASVFAPKQANRLINGELAAIQNAGADLDPTYNASAIPLVHPVHKAVLLYIAKFIKRGGGNSFANCLGGTNKDGTFGSILGKQITKLKNSNPELTVATGEYYANYLMAVKAYTAAFTKWQEDKGDGDADTETNSFGLETDENWNEYTQLHDPDLFLKESGCHYGDHQQLVKNRINMADYQVLNPVLFPELLENAGVQGQVMPVFNIRAHLIPCFLGLNPKLKDACQTYDDGNLGLDADAFEEIPPGLQYVPTWPYDRTRLTSDHTCHEDFASRRTMTIDSCQKIISMKWKFQDGQLEGRPDFNIAPYNIVNRKCLTEAVPATEIEGFSGPMFFRYWPGQEPFVRAGSEETPSTELAALLQHGDIGDRQRPYIKNVSFWHNCVAHANPRRTTCANNKPAADDQATPYQRADGLAFTAFDKTDFTIHDHYLHHIKDDPCRVDAADQKQLWNPTIIMCESWERIDPQERTRGNLDKIQMRPSDELLPRVPADFII